MNLSAIILAGGESKRMGQDKAWLQFQGHSLLALAISKVRQLGILEVLISGRAGTDYSGLDCPVLIDLEPGVGPLGGIERGLHTCRSPLILVLAVDLPYMSPAFLTGMMARCDVATGIVPKLAGQLEPLAAIYPKRCHHTASDCIAQSHRMARKFAEACWRHHAVGTFDVTRTESRNFTNWNVPTDITPFAANQQ